MGSYIVHNLLIYEQAAFWNGTVHLKRGSKVMNERFKKTISLAICSSMLLSMASCSLLSIEDKVLDLADDLAKAVVARDYNKVIKLAGKEDDDLEAAMSLSTDTSAQINDAREVIANTLTYEIDEDSYKGDSKMGSVDVVFTYVDYEKVEEEVPVFVDIDDFEEAVEDCKDTVEQTVTFKFAKKDGDIICTNVGVATDVFPYATEEFNFALGPAEYIGGFDFVGSNTGFVCNDVTSLTCELSVIGDGQYLTWEYYYTVEVDGTGLYQSDTITEETPTELTATYSSDDGELLPDGEYYFAFYTVNSEFIYGAYCDVTHTEITPSPTPTPVPYSGQNVTPGAEYTYPEDGIVAVPGTDMVFDLPDGYVCLAPEDPKYQEIMDGDQWMADNAFLCADNGEGADVVVIRLTSGQGYEAQADGFSETVEALASSYTQYGMVTTINTSYYVGDRNFPAGIIIVSRGYGESDICISLCLIGDEDDAFLVTVLSDSQSDLYDIMAGLSIV